MASKKTNWEKIGIYLAILSLFLTIVFYVVEIKVDIAVLKTKVENIEKGKTK